MRTAFALLALLAAAGASAQAPPYLDCASLPQGWGNDEVQEDNQNGPWEALAEQPSQELYQTVWGDLLQRFPAPITNNANIDWSPATCEDWTAAAVGCQQTAGDEGMNYALQVNFTCGQYILGVTTDVYTSAWGGFSNIDANDIDPEFLADAASGAILIGDLDNNLAWWEANDDVWGNAYSMMPGAQGNPGSNENNDDEQNQDENNNENNYENQDQNDNQNQNQ